MGVVVGAMAGCSHVRVHPSWPWLQAPGPGLTDSRTLASRTLGPWPHGLSDPGLRISDISSPGLRISEISRLGFKAISHTKAILG